MPLNQKGSKVFSYGEEGYNELFSKQRAKSRKPLTLGERVAKKKFEENRKRHNQTSRAEFKLRSPRI